jgi:hypothetical protein
MLCCFVIPCEDRSSGVIDSSLANNVPLDAGLLSALIMKEITKLQLWNTLYGTCDLHLVGSRKLRSARDAAENASGNEQCC